MLVNEMKKISNTNNLNKTALEIIKRNIEIQSIRGLYQTMFLINEDCHIFNEYVVKQLQNEGFKISKRKINNEQYIVIFWGNCEEDKKVKPICSFEEAKIKSIKNFNDSIKF